MQLKSNPSLTILTIVFGFLIFNFFFESMLLSYTIILLSGLGVLSLKISIIVEKVWFKVTFILSQIIPNILLTLIFFLILTPTAFMSKIFSAKGNLILKNNRKTIFITRNNSFDKKGFERAW